MNRLREGRGSAAAVLVAALALFAYPIVTDADTPAGIDAVRGSAACTWNTSSWSGGGCVDGACAHTANVTNTRGGRWGQSTHSCGACAGTYTDTWSCLASTPEPVTP